MEFRREDTLHQIKFAFRSPWTDTRSDAFFVHPGGDVDAYNDFNGVYWDSCGNTLIQIIYKFRSPYTWSTAGAYFVIRGGDVNYSNYFISDSYGRKLSGRRRLQQCVLCGLGWRRRQLLEYRQFPRAESHFNALRTSSTASASPHILCA